MEGGAGLIMWEVQEAGRIITESIDKDAKVIFGAVNDPNLKKNELKVTVIASGFPEMARKQGASGPAAGEAEHAPVSGDFSAEVRRAQHAAHQQQSSAETSGQDEWDAVPAFLRRSRR